MKYCGERKGDSLQFKVIEKLRQSKYHMRSLANTASFLKLKIVKESSDSKRKLIGQNKINKRQEISQKVKQEKLTNKVTIE